jgi:hypothetical protein
MPTIPEIKSELKKLGIKGYSKLNKAELLDLLSKHQNVKSNDNIKEMKKMRKQLLKMDIPKVKEIEYDFSKFDKKENNENDFINELLKLKREDDKKFYHHTTYNKISDYYGVIDATKFYEIFHKLDMRGIKIKTHTDINYIMKIFLEYYKNHKLTFKQWLELLNDNKTYDNMLDRINHEIYYKKGIIKKEDVNKEINKNLEKEYIEGNKGLKQKIYILQYDLKQKEIEVDTIKRKRKKDDAWRIELAREWKNLNDMQEEYPKRIQQYQDYINEYEKLKPSGGRRYRKITPSMYF